MRAIYRPVFLVLLLALTSCGSTHYYVVRHAEKLNNSDTSPLTECGTRRAKALADRLAGKSIDFIFVSNRRRTKDTAAPTAALFGLIPREIPEQNTNQLIAELKAIHRQNIFTQSVLVVRHSSEIHLIVNALSPLDTIASIGDQFNNLFVIRRTDILGQREIHLERSTYGAPCR